MYRHLFKYRNKWHIGTDQWEFPNWVEGVTDVIFLNDTPYYQRKNGKLLHNEKTPVDSAELTFLLLKVEEIKD